MDFHFLQEHWATALQTLDLTLDEVVHIRTVLTKAELESLPLDGSLKEDVEKGKVCFLCMKTRFGFFSRGCKCELCSRQVCAKCSTKVKHALLLLLLRQQSSQNQKCKYGLKMQHYLHLTDFESRAKFGPKNNYVAPLLNRKASNVRSLTAHF